MRVRWRKRIWRLPGARLRREHLDRAGRARDPRRVPTRRAAEWATNRVAAIEGTPASIARNFGLSWSTVWSAVNRIGSARIQTPAKTRIGPVVMVAFDESVMSPASRRRRRRLVRTTFSVLLQMTLTKRIKQEAFALTSFETTAIREPLCAGRPNGTYSPSSHPPDTRRAAIPSVRGGHSSCLSTREGVGASSWGADRTAGDSLHCS